ncbi:MAG: hypothetical protein JSV89_18505 [Spirochaetaceae bacterium]|nr:MAG: hypothetical protein JSV89_18505 [Spirochaetaceae bacterium]
MKLPDRYSSDVQTIVRMRHHNGGDFWATPDGRIGKGSPFSTRDCVLMLIELQTPLSDPLLRGAAELAFQLWREDGRFRAFPRGTIYPCHTIGTARLLCYLGHADDDRVKRTFQHLLDSQYTDGGWRCKKFSFGRGPETEYSNPGPTLEALDAFRFSGVLNQDARLDRAVEFLLYHWEVKRPLGPCHFGMGSLFNRVEYPFLRYNLFYYVYVLSFYDRAWNDSRFLEALRVLESKLSDGKIVIENCNRKLRELEFCQKGVTSDLATSRYLEIKTNLESK